ncbi:MAG: metallo-mystery pair system four-Cys motif protein, partial [Leptospiraceae bacterium]|nr:metallo-mystery pair system four-Cys motif protein [Leptospiraceae bacterium]
MKYLLILLIVFANFCNLPPFSKKEDDSKSRNLLLLGAIAVSQPSYPNLETLYFKAILNNHEIECGSHTYTLPAGQTVQIRDFRMFVQDVQFVKFDGTKVPFTFSNVEKYQVREGNDQVGLLDFTKVGSGACSGTSDDDTTNKSIKGSAPGGIYKRVEITLGVPQSMNHQDPSQRSSSHPLRSGTGLTWNWQAGYKFMRIELEVPNFSPVTRLLLHLGSTACNGAIPNVTCNNPYRPTLIVEPKGGFDTTKDTIVFDADELFKSNGGLPTSAFSAGTSLSCMPIGNGAGTGGTPQTCGPI